LKDARYLGVDPWDLIDLPESKPFWVSWAGIARIAELQAQEDAQARQANPALAHLSRPPAPGATVKR
jgi:hypothetical protein